jgi:predicted component of type VI protein secretion system
VQDWPPFEYIQIHSNPFKSMFPRSPAFALVLACFVLTAASHAADPPSAVHVERAEKIAAGLGLSDSAQTLRVRDLIAAQYRDLSRVHDLRDEALKAAQTSPDREAGTQAAKDTASARMADLHYAYLAALSVELTPEQLEKVKDGMTYGVVPLTFGVYREMLPDLTEEQKRRLLAWLREAREHAMTAGSSNEKHGWFGKYKGRINNYLSAAGIDMKQAERDMMERKKKAAGN